MGSLEQVSAMSDASNDGEGVWSPDIEAAFQEALLIYKPCGRRKHIIQDEGNASKMYGRNELIARHIKTHTGKTRTRKQVSSHIQVLARRKAKQHHELASTSGTPSPGSEASVVSQQPAPHLHSLNNHHHQQLQPHLHPLASAAANQATPQPQATQQHPQQQPQPQTHLQQTVVQQCPSHEPVAPLPASAKEAADWQHAAALSYYDLWQDRPIATQKIRLVEFSAFIEHRNPPPPPASLDELQALSPLEYAARLPLPLATNNQLQPTPVHLNHQHSHQFISHTGAPVRHCYIRIDYTQPSERFLGKQQLEQVEASQVQDKFPNIIGPAGLFHRASSDAFFLVKFWADIGGHLDAAGAADDQNSYFGFSTTFETPEPLKDITCSTKACSYGLQVVEKVDKLYAAYNSANGRYSYTIESSPMCDFMSKFIKKLRQLPRLSQMNSVLENFTVLQVVSSQSTAQILLCLAYVFEVAPADGRAAPYHHGPQYHVYKLTKD